MAKKVSFSTLHQLYLRLAIPGINKALEVRDVIMKSIAPTDTGDYIRSFSIVPAMYQGTRVIGSNLNDSDHAFGVEFGFRKTPVNRHKGPPRNSSTVIYNGIGARVMTRSVEQTRDDTMQFIIDSINQGLNS